MRKKVMIIEDNELNMKLFRDLVELSGYDVVELRSGSHAMEVALAEKPSLLVLDIQLPEISGIEIIKYFKANEQLKSIPIIAVTAFAMAKDEESIKAAGCEYYMSKPINIANFQSVLKSYLANAISPT